MCALQAHKWDDAHKVAVTYMSESDIAMLYIPQAQRLEAQHRFKDAEKLYLLVKEPDLAINMYKKQRKYDQMIRLVTTYRKDLLKETHLHLAQQLEMEGSFRDAEHHYAEAGEWLLAVNMYRSNDAWDEAIRVAKYHGAYLLTCLGAFSYFTLLTTNSLLVFPHLTSLLVRRRQRLQARGVRVGAGAGRRRRLQAADEAGAHRAGHRLRH